MNVAVRSPAGPIALGADAPASDVARVAVFRELSAVEPLWRRFERAGTVLTPYQRFDFLGSWQRNVGERAGIAPCIVVGFDLANEPAFLWPFGERSIGPLRVLGFLGGKHANFNLGLWRRERAAAMTAEGLRVIFARLRADGLASDLAILRNQPPVWEQFANPFAMLPHRPSVDDASRTALARPGLEFVDANMSATNRRKLRAKERKLEELPGYRYARATTPAEVTRMLDSFFTLKPVHLAALGVRNVFAEPGVEQFVREASLSGLSDGAPVIEVHGIEGDGEVIAMFAGASDGRRFTSMFNTYTTSEHSRHSPGLVLLRRLIAAQADCGVAAFDLGIGDASYKALFCRDTEKLFDSFIPFSPLGRVAAFAARNAQHMKRRIKQTPALWSALQAVRRGAASLRAR